MSRHEPEIDWVFYLLMFALMLLLLVGAFLYAVSLMETAALDPYRWY